MTVFSCGFCGEVGYRATYQSGSLSCGVVPKGIRRTASVWPRSLATWSDFSIMEKSNFSSCGSKNRQYQRQYETVEGR